MKPHIFWDFNKYMQIRITANITSTHTFYQYVEIVVGPTSQMWRIWGVFEVAIGARAVGNRPT